MARRSPFAQAGLSETFAALADPTRRAMVQMLGQGQKPVGELAAAFALSAPAISKHLRVLRQSLLVEEQRDSSDARLRVYRLRPEPLHDLDAWLVHMRTFWALQLDAFAAHVATRAANTPMPQRQTISPEQKQQPTRRRRSATAAPTKRPRRAGA